MSIQIGLKTTSPESDINAPIVIRFLLVRSFKNQLEVLQLAAQLEVFVTTSVFGFLFAVSED